MSYDPMEYFRPTAVVVDDELLASIRGAVVGWKYAEYGAPALHPGTPLSSTRMDPSGLWKVFLLFVRLGGLATGPRSFPNVVAAMGPFDRYSHGIPPNWFGCGTIEVDVRNEHLAVLRSMGIDALSFGPSPGFDPKRPLGCLDPVRDIWEMSNGSSRDEDGNDLMPGSAATAGGTPPVDPEVRRCYEVYMDMPAVLQVFMREAVLGKGLYVGVPALGDWRKAESADDLVWRPGSASAEGREGAACDRAG